mgnify:CR=1 FL=1
MREIWAGIADLLDGLSGHMSNLPFVFFFIINNSVGSDFPGEIF